MNFLSKFYFDLMKLYLNMRKIYSNTMYFPYIDNEKIGSFDNEKDISFYFIPRIPITSLVLIAHYSLFCFFPKKKVINIFYFN